jgi:putative flippase GtrA
MNSSLRILVLYLLFASLSTLINIGTQMLSLVLYRGKFDIEISIFAGTLAGLPIRYYLEKKYIFQFISKNIVHDGRLFILYIFMAFFTTMIFWATEYSFHLIFLTDHMRYIGAILGLSLGYFIKYKLDKKFVFVSNQSKMMI